MIKKLMRALGYVHVNTVTLLTFQNFSRYVMSHELTPDEAEILIRTILTRTRKPGNTSQFMTDLSSIAGRKYNFTGWNEWINQKGYDPRQED